SALAAMSSLSGNHLCRSLRELLHRYPRDDGDRGVGILRVTQVSKFAASVAAAAALAVGAAAAVSVAARHIDLVLCLWL
ncbi:hypothetical protein, partial [Neisseria meningitidis]